MKSKKKVAVITVMLVVVCFLGWIGVKIMRGYPSSEAPFKYFTNYEWDDISKNSVDSLKAELKCKKGILTLTIYGEGEMIDFGKIKPEEGGKGWHRLYVHGPDGFFKAPEEIVIEEGVENIGNRAFYCYYFDKITIPKSVKKIGTEAFIYCGTYSKEFSKIVYNGTVAEWDKIEFDENWGKIRRIESIECTDGVISLIDENSYTYPNILIK